MTNTNDNRDVDTIWFAIRVFVHEISKYLAAVKAVAEIQKDVGKEKWTDNKYLNIAEDAIWRQLLLDITKLFDKEKTGKHNNCSLKTLKAICLEEKSHVFPKGNDDLLMRLIDFLYAKYERIVSSEIRNKKVAHYDLSAIYTLSKPYIVFTDIEELISQTTIVIRLIGVRLWGIPLEYPPVLAEKYKEAILNLIDEKKNTVK